MIYSILFNIFGLEIDNSPCPEFKYDMKTNYANLFGRARDYAYGKIELLNELKQFKKEYEFKCI